MNIRTRKLEDFVACFDKDVANKLREQQAIQAFDGTLRVRANHVYVNKKDGVRAIERLKVLRQAQE